MTRYAAFLRGVNVGGVNLKMAEVAKSLTEAGFTDVKTILASGNVLLDQRSAVMAVRTKAEAALRDAFGYDAWVLAYDLETVRAISDALSVRARGRRDTTRTSRSSPMRTCSTSSPGWPSTRVQDEKIERGDGVIYWQVPKTARSTPRSARPWARSGTSRRPPRATCARSTRCGRASDRSGRFATVNSEPKIDDAVLTGVSETALLTLQVRADGGTSSPTAIIDDPMAIELVDSIEFDFAKFGYTRRQDMALRALAFDDATRATWSTTRRRPSSRSPRGCRPASTASPPGASATGSAG